jgi:hypothetical protein
MIRYPYAMQERMTHKLIPGTMHKNEILKLNLNVKQETFRGIHSKKNLCDLGPDNF